MRGQTLQTWRGQHAAVGRCGQSEQKAGLTPALPTGLCEPDGHIRQTIIWKIPNYGKKNPKP